MVLFLVLYVVGNKCLCFITTCTAVPRSLLETSVLIEYTAS